MKIAIFGFLALSAAGAVGLFLQTTSASNDPLSVVENYCHYSTQGSWEEVRGYTTAVPDEYWESQARDLAKLRLEVQMETPGIESEPTIEASPAEDVGGISHHSDEARDSAFLTLVNDEIPALMERNAEFVAEIVQIWEEGKKSKVRVKMKSKKSEAYSSEVDFFLYLTDEGWKIFRVATASQFDSYAS